MTTVAVTLHNLPVWVKNVLLVLGASILMGLFAHISIPLPFTPVPIVAQNGVILLLAVLLGSRRAPLAVALFLAQGIAGLPVFANGFSGWARLVGPSGGYLVGYFFAAWLVGWVIERSGARTLRSGALAMLLGHAVIYVAGFAWLSTFVGMGKAIELGVIPFLLGDFLKFFISLKLLQWIRWDRKVEKTEKNSREMVPE